MLSLSGNISAFNTQILQRLNARSRQDPIFSNSALTSPSTSAVLFLLGLQPPDFLLEPCLILTKRSLSVRQPGDLCCPGGRVSSLLDSFLARLLNLPGSPLQRWPYWSWWRVHRKEESRILALLLATSLRETFEEIRLNPFGLKFFGPLPSQRLIMFRREIYPMVCWIANQKRLFPNWEVEKVVYIPIKHLLNPSKYAQYRLHINIPQENQNPTNRQDFPCFLHEHSGEFEILWGATFRITMVFLDIVFGFKPPAMESLPVVLGTLDENYLTGNG